MTTEARDPLTGAPSDVEGGMPATTGAPAAFALTADERAAFGAIADRLIPAAHGMPSAAEVVTDARLGFVLDSRPDLAEPLRRALRAELGNDVASRLSALASEPTSLSALQLAIVAGYYTDRRVRELIGYPGQMAIEVRSWELPPYIEEGLIDKLMTRGPVWRDPATGKRAQGKFPRTYAERWSQMAAEQGGPDGRDEAG